MAKTDNAAGSKLDRIDTFVVTGVITILLIRAYLSLTNYPQIGSDSLHIAHVLFGGFFLVFALLLAILSDRPNKLVVAFLGGIGFGLFIDEIGKFLTKDNNYFYEPSVGIMYIIFLVIWVLSRFIIVRTTDTSFLSPAEWPEQRVFRLAIVLWSLLQVAALALLVGATAVIGIREIAEIIHIPRLGIALSWIYAGWLALGLQRYYSGRMIDASHTLRASVLFGVVAVYPFVYIYYPLTATLGMAGMILVIIGLSEVSIVKVSRKIFNNIRKHSTDILRT